jgi:hypothetical protein
MTKRDPLARALSRLRDIEPPVELADRLDLALRQAEARERSEAARRPEGGARRALGRNLLLFVPALASMAVALHLVVAEPAFDVGRTAEHALDLPSHGHGSLSVDLLLDEHDTDYAAVRMHLPRGVSLADAGGTRKAASCEEFGCIYEFMHSTAADAPPLELRVAGPGRYRVHVEHASKDRRVQEVLVLHARR